MPKTIFPILFLILASLACSLPGAGAPPDNPRLVIPTFTPTSQVMEKPTDLPAVPTFTPEPTALQPSADAFDPIGIADCDIFLDADFPNTVGSIPTSKQAIPEDGRKTCQYNFENGSILVSITTNLPGREAYDNVRQYDALSGGTVTPYSIGEIAIIKDFGDGRLTLEAVLKGWYIVLDERGFDKKHLALLAEVLLTNLIPYYPY